MVSPEQVQSMRDREESFLPSLIAVALYMTLGTRARWPAGYLFRRVKTVAGKWRLNTLCWRTKAETRTYKTLTMSIGEYENEDLQHRLTRGGGWKKGRIGWAIT